MKNEKLLNTTFKECLFFVFCLFCFLLLSNNILHVMFYTYICYWNTFQHKHNNLIISCAIDFKRYLLTLYHICLLFIILFLCLFLFCLDFEFWILSFVSTLNLWSSPLSSLLNWPRVQVYLKVPNHIKELTFWISDVLSIA